jgi:HEAT repeat protein
MLLERMQVFILEKLCAVDALSNVMMRNDLKEPPVVSVLSALALGRLGKKRAVPALVKASSLATPSAPVRVAACVALGRIGDTAAVKALEGGLYDRDGIVRKAALISLACVGGECVVDLICKRVLDGDAGNIYRKNAVYLLGLIGDPRAIKPLAELALEYPEFNSDVSQALFRIADANEGGNYKPPDRKKLTAVLSSMEADLGSLRWAGGSLL